MQEAVKGKEELSRVVVMTLRGEEYSCFSRKTAILNKEDGPVVQ